MTTATTTTEKIIATVANVINETVNATVDAIVEEIKRPCGNSGVDARRVSISDYKVRHWQHLGLWLVFVGAFFILSVMVLVMFIKQFPDRIGRGFMFSKPLGVAPPGSLPYDTIQPASDSGIETPMRLLSQMPWRQPHSDSSSENTLPRRKKRQ
jgi:hypothetical protein